LVFYLERNLMIPQVAVEKVRRLQLAVESTT
jgi:hypothetical protein